MELLGAEVRPVESGTRTLKDAINEAMRDWVTNVRTTFYLIGSAVGPHPYPTIVRDFQSVIGRESRAQILEQAGRLPDAVVACVGGGSNAIGMFAGFVDDPSVKLIGVEPGGRGMGPNENAATLVTGSVGVLHGTRTLVLQDENGQILGTHSVSAGLDYPGVGPEHSFLQASGRARYVAVSDEDALRGFRQLCRLEGIIPALEPSHAIAYLPRPGAGARAGRTDRAEPLRSRRQGHRQLPRGDGRPVMSRRRTNRLDATFARLKQEGRIGFFPYLMAGYPDRETSARLLDVIAEAGADGFELGIPFSDPLADGVTIQRASARRPGAGRVASAMALDMVAELPPAPRPADRHDELRQPAAGVRPRQALRGRRPARRRRIHRARPLASRKRSSSRRSAPAAGLHYVYLVAPTSDRGPPDAGRRARPAASSTASRWSARLAPAASFRPSWRRSWRVRGPPSRRRWSSASASRRRRTSPAWSGQADGAIVASALVDAIEQTPPESRSSARAVGRRLRRRAVGRATDAGGQAATSSPGVRCARWAP